MNMISRNEYLHFQGGIAICFILIILHFISIIVPALSMLIDSIPVRKLLYWLFNILSPSINSQALVTYILAKGSTFCQGRSEEHFSDDTMGGNIAILILHILLLFGLLIAIDCGLLHFFWSNYDERHFDENTLDNDVLIERQRVLASTGHGDEENNNNLDYLTVKNLVKFYPRRKVLAVNHLTFGAKRGEAFGLLGYNVSQEKFSSTEVHFLSIRALEKLQHFVFSLVNYDQHKVLL